MVQKYLPHQVPESQCLWGQRQLCITGIDEHKTSNY